MPDEQGLRDGLLRFAVHPRPYPTMIIADPRDVVFGRGGMARHRQGNRRYRQIVEQYRQETLMQLIQRRRWVYLMQPIREAQPAPAPEEQNRKRFKGHYQKSRNLKFKERSKPKSSQNNKHVRRGFCRRR